MAGSRSFGANGVQCVRLTDGELPYPPTLLLANAEPEELAGALAGELDETGMIVGRFNPLLIRAPDADAVLHEVGFEHPEWTCAIDIDPPLAVATRRALLERATDEGLLVAGYHLDRHGYVKRNGEAFRLVAESA